MKNLKYAFVMLFVSMVLGGCASPGLKEFSAKNGDVVRIIDTGVGLSGGPRMQIVQTYNASGNLVDSAMASGEGTFQTATHFGLTAPVTAAVAGHYLKDAAGNYRPDSYNSSNIVNGGTTSSQGGAGGAGGQAQGGNVADGAVKVTSNGGASTANSTSAGGSSSFSASQTQSQSQAQKTGDVSVNLKNMNIANSRSLSSAASNNTHHVEKTKFKKNREH